MTCNILIFGFSVTEDQNGYVKTLKQILSSFDNNLIVESRAIGGAAIPITQYLSDLLELYKYKYVLYEIATCLRFSEDNPDEYTKYLTQIVTDCVQAGSIPCFLNLFRGDVNYNDDVMSMTIVQFANSNGIPCIDLTNVGIRAMKRGNINVFFRDGTHTTSAGAHYYALAISKFFIDVTLNTPNIAILRDRFYIGANKYTFISAEDVIKIAPTGVCSRGGFALPYVEIPASARLWCEIPSNYLIRGVCFTKGPRSGIIEISIIGLDGNLSVHHKIHAYDEFCYYERHSYWMRPLPDARRVAFLQYPNLIDIKLRKGLVDISPRVARITGFLVERIPMPDSTFLPT